MLADTHDIQRTSPLDAVGRREDVPRADEGAAAVPAQGAAGVWPAVQRHPGPVTRRRGSSEHDVVRQPTCGAHTAALGC